MILNFLFFLFFFISETLFLGLILETLCLCVLVCTYNEPTERKINFYVYVDGEMDNMHNCFEERVGPDDPQWSLPP